MISIQSQYSFFTMIKEHHHRRNCDMNHLQNIIEGMERKIAPNQCNIARNTKIFHRHLIIIEFLFVRKK
jgi:hypothetical protein